MLRACLILIAALASSCATAGNAKRDPSEPRAAARDLGPCPVVRVVASRHAGPWDPNRVECVVELELDQAQWPARYSREAGWKLFGIEIRPGIAGLLRFELLDCRRDAGYVVATAKSLAGPESTRFVFAIRGSSRESSAGQFDLIQLEEERGALIESVPLTGSAAPPVDLATRLDDWHGWWIGLRKLPSGRMLPYLYVRIGPNGEDLPVRMYNLARWSWNGTGSADIAKLKCPASEPNVAWAGGAVSYSADEVWLSTTPLEKWRGAVLALNMSFEPIESQARP